MLQASGRICFLVLLFVVTSSFAKHPAQRLAPAVGRWRIDLTMEGQNHSLEFETDDEGRYGLGNGYLVVLPLQSSSREYPASWWNIDPQHIRISAEIDFRNQDTPQRGTLVLRRTLGYGLPPKGEARFIDEALAVHSGSFTMTSIAPSEQLKKKIK